MIRKLPFSSFICIIGCSCFFAHAPRAVASDPIDIGSRRELFVDQYLIERMEGAQVELHHPRAEEVVIVHDEPWEGNTCYYHTIFKDDDVYRMYYRGSNHVPGKKASHQVVCYAESKDGVKWTKPNLGIVEYGESKQNNIIWDGVGRHNFVPFKDSNPNCQPEAQYKAIGGIKPEGGLFVFQSSDAIHWKLLNDKPVITEGAFDSQNLAFWDANQSCYIDYHRNGRDGKRDIMTCTSPDFIHWTKPKFLSYTDAPPEDLYVNQIQPYFRAPHIYLGFPKRFLPLRRSPVDHPLPGISDTVLMSSRDGQTFHRWQEAFIRPGPQPDRWVCRNNLVAWGMVETQSALEEADDELSFYLIEGYYQGESCRVRRHTMRVDGFTSVSASLKGGRILTKPIVFSGTQLELNFSTSAAGSLRVEIQDESGTPLKRFTLAEFPEMFGDSTAQKVTWKNNADLSSLAGKPVRLLFELKDADLYSFRFVEN